MKAVVCNEWGPPDSLCVETKPEPQPNAGEVLVDIMAAGVNFPDVLIIQNKYQFRPELPFTPGNELAGLVRAVGEGVEGFKFGDRVFGYVPQERAIDRFLTGREHLELLGALYHLTKEEAAKRIVELLKIGRAHV